MNDSQNPVMDNGILARIPGDYIARAQLKMPPIATVTDDEPRTVEIDVPGIGLVRIYARRHLARRGKHQRWFWSAFRAELVE